MKKLFYFLTGTITGAVLSFVWLVRKAKSDPVYSFREYLDKYFQYGEPDVNVGVDFGVPPDSSGQDSEGWGGYAPTITLRGLESESMSNYVESLASDEEITKPIKITILKY